mgnify:CR=1 FL=1
MKTLITFLSVGVIVVFTLSIAVITGMYSTILQLRYEKTQIEEEFQVYRSGAQDAYSFAIGENVEYGEKIPNEFFMRYTSENLTPEESLMLYKDAKKIVSKRLKVRYI